MTPADESGGHEPKSTYRSRWGRFSPSMGWKVFWSEIVIVILGVLIALAANEAVQNWNWRNKVQDGEIRLRADVDSIFIVAAEQYSTAACVQAQLTDLSRKLTQSGQTWAPITVNVDEATQTRFIVRIPSRNHAFPVWDSLIADGTATRFTQEAQRAYGSIRARLERAQELNEQANELNWRLMALTHPMALSDDARRYFLVNIEEFRGRYAASSLQAGQSLNSIHDSGKAPEAKALDTAIAGSGTVKFCKAHGYSLADWRDALKP
jgi:hypothetical protein